MNFMLKNPWKFTWIILSLFVVQCLLVPPLSGDEAEDLFMSGYEKFEAGDYEEALTYFEQVLERFPDRNRGRDSRYFIDRLRLYSVRGGGRQPLVRVLLEEKPQISGQFKRPYILLGQDMEELTEFDSNQSWEASLEDGAIVFSTGDQEFKLQEVRLEPLSMESGYLNFEEIEYRGRVELLRSGSEIKVINELPLNKYLYGVIKKELAPDWPMEVMKAQAVASRSFALNMMAADDIGDGNLRADVSAQVYEGKTAESERGRQAVEATRGEILVYAGEIVPAYFHANSGGYIEDGRHIWGGDGFPFIEPGPDSWSEQTQHYRWEEELPIAEINDRLAAAGHTAMGSNPDLRSAGFLRSGRASEVSYRSASGERVNLNANEFRMAIGGDKIRSSWFEEIQRSGQNIVFEGRGWGHGVGMSQWGAKEMAEAGKSYSEILQFYFRHAELSNRLDEYLGMSDQEER